MTGDTAPRFELLRLAAEEVAEGVAVVELEGRWAGEAPAAGDARLLAGDAEVAPVDGAADVHDGILKATFAVPAAAAASGPLVLSADGVRVRLPDPDGPRADRLAALARELNRVRHERDALRAQAADHEGLAAEVATLRRDHEDLGRLRAALDDARRERDELALAVKEVEVLRRERDELALAVNEVAVLRRERDEAQAAAKAAKEAAKVAKDEALRLQHEADRAAEETPPTAVRRPAVAATPVGAEARPPAVYFSLAALGVVGFLTVLVLLL